jgi:hypothetical protein
LPGSGAGGMGSAVLRVSQKPRRISVAQSGAAGVADEAATLRITSLPSFLVGINFPRDGGARQISMRDDGNNRRWSCFPRDSMRPRRSTCIQVCHGWCGVPDLRICISWRLKLSLKSHRNGRMIRCASSCHDGRSAVSRTQCTCGDALIPAAAKSRRASRLLPPARTGDEPPAPVLKRESRAARSPGA